MQNKLLKNEKGSITLFVLLAILFFLMVIFSLFITSSNKNTIQSSEIDKIKEEYQESVDNIDQIYDIALNKNTTNLLKVGDYVNYTPEVEETTYGVEKLGPDITGSSNNKSAITQDSSMKWKILNIDASGRVDLISEMPTSQSVYFSGVRGYNNGVYVINDICRSLYSNSSLGIEARSLDLKDIEDQMNDAGITARDEYNKNSSSGAQYGKTKTYGSVNNQYPELYARENGSGINTETVKEDGIDVNADGYDSPTIEDSSTAEEGLTVTQTYYYMGSSSSYFDDQEFYDMVFNTGSSYWLASRFAHCSSTYADFGLRYVNNSDLGGNIMFDSYGNTLGTLYRLRPVVSLGSDIQITPVENADGSSPENMHQISKKIAK